MQKPQSRNEAILQSMIADTEYTDPPQSRIEALLLKLKEVIEAGGGEIVVDDEISTTSTHPVQNRVIAANLLPAIAGITPNSSGSMELDREDLNDFTTSGIYNAMNCENAPFNDMALVILGYSMDGYCVQIACDVASGNFKFRNQIDGNWTAWGDNILSTLEAHTAAINELENNTKSIQTVTGNHLTIEASESNLVECVAEVECVQEGSGDPSPDNTRPIIGQTEVVIEDVGKNLFDINNFGGKQDSSTTYSFDGNKLTITGKWYVWFYANVKPNTNYVFSRIIDSFTVARGLAFLGLNSDGTINESDLITNSSEIFNSGDRKKIAILLYSGNNTSGTTVMHNIQLEEGTTATTYEPYQGKTYRIEIGQKNKWKFGDISGDGYIYQNEPYELEKGTYTISCGSVTGTMSIAFYDSNNTKLADSSFTSSRTIQTITINSKSAKVNVFCNSATATDIQLEQGSQATPYVPYNPNLPDTIYGGELDVITGELRVTHEMYDIPSTDWINNTNNPTCWILEHSAPNSINVSNQDTEIRIITDFLKSTTAKNIVDTIATTGYENTIAIISDNRYLAKVEKSIFATKEDFMAYISANSPKVVYELAEPYTIQLTPQQIKLLKGTNHLSCNTGDLSIKYYPDNVLGQLKGDIEDEYDERITTLDEKTNNALKIKSITTTTGTNQQGVSSSSYDNYVQGDKKLIPLSITAKTPGYEVVDVHYVLDEINRLIYFIPKDLTGSAIPSGRTVSMTIYYFEI